MEGWTKERGKKLREKGKKECKKEQSQRYNRHKSGTVKYGIRWKESLKKLVERQKKMKKNENVFSEMSWSYRDL